ncbi:MAG: hypothetical protein ACT4OV_03120 [Microthrixaceae bacterium]
MIDRSIRRADARFILPRHPATAVVLEPESGWDRALQLAGITEVRRGDAVPDLVVAGGRQVAAAADLAAPMVLLEGAASIGPLRAAGYEVARYLVLPDVAHPEIVLPLDARDAIRYALQRRTVAAPRARAIAAQAGAIGVALLLRVVRPGSVLTLASRIGREPFVLGEVAARGFTSAASWYLHLGRSDELAERRMAFLVFSAAARSPAWAVKVARVPGMDDAFDRDERGLAVLTQSAPDLADRAPRLVGRSSVAGVALSVETAAVGDRATEVLRRGGTEARQLISAVCAWLVELAGATRLPPEELAAERLRFEADVAPAWEGQADVGSLVTRLQDVPAVLVHSDLGTWNIVATGREFSIVDWESARRAGLPLWDLLYFLADACAQVARRARPGDRAEYLVSLFRGEAELSSVLFEWVRRAAAASSLAPESVGLIATLGWLHRAAPFLRSDDQAVTEPDMVRFARQWLADADLGPTWSRWR